MVCAKGWKMLGVYLVCNCGEEGKAQAKKKHGCAACVDSCTSGCMAGADRSSACEVVEVAGGRYVRLRTGGRVQANGVCHVFHSG
jgi:hypothetical protein